MFDFSRLTESLSGLFGNAPVADSPMSGDAMSLLQNAGLDPGLLEGLTQHQLFEMLAQYGIDPAQLGADQLAQLLPNIGVDPQLTEVATNLLSDGER